MDSQVDINGKTKTEVLELLNNFQQALESEKKYHDTLDNLLEGFQIISFDWQYMYVNKTVVQQGKFTRDELLGHTMMEKYPGIEHTKMFEALRFCMNARVSKRFENRFPRPDGSAGWLELNIQPTEGGIIILSYDITERKRSEQERTEDIKGIERILSMTSYNLQQPIAHIRGLVNILKTCKNSPEELDKIIDHLEISATSLDTYTREITGFVYNLETKASKQK